MRRSCMRSEELNTIKYVIKNFNLLKTQLPSQCTTMIRLTKLSCTHFKAKILEK